MITVNCIGAGRWGPNLIRAMDNLPDARVRQVADLDESALARIREHMSGIHTTTDIEQVVLDPAADAVAIATPVRTHYELSRMALEAGKHVFVEKPLCRSVDACHDLIDRAQKADLILAVGHVFLFNPGIRKIQDYIRAGELGRIQYVHATRTNLGPIRDDVNAAWDLASHDLSIFDYWLGATPTSVRASGSSFLGRSHEDVVVATYRYPAGVLGFVHVSWLNPRKVREITVVGDRKMAVWDDMDLIEPVRVYDKSASAELPEYADSFGAARTTIREGDVVIPRVSGAEPLRAQCAHFIECIRGSVQPINNARMATSVVETLIATEASMRQDGAETLVCRSTRPDKARYVSSGQRPEASVH